MDIIATQKFIRMAPRKLRLVVPLIKNISPIMAVEVLPHIGKRAAEPLRKVILSAIANAKEKKLSENDLVFKEIQVGEGPRLKRYHAGARGMAKPYKREMSHIRVVLETKPGVNEKIKVTDYADSKRITQIKSVKSKAKVESIIDSVKSKVTRKGGSTRSKSV